jgi:hypothetical protein
MKYKLVKGVDHDCLGEFDPNTKKISIFVDKIIQKAKKWVCDHRDLKKLVILHEQAHYLYDKNEVLFLSDHDEEVSADQYAVKMFFKMFNRWPNVPINKWSTKEAIA